MGDGFGFVAGRDDYGDFWPCGWRRVRGGVVVEGVEAPETSTSESKVEPDCGGEDCGGERCAGHAFILQ